MDSIMKTDIPIRKNRLIGYKNLFGDPFQKPWSTNKSLILKRLFFILKVHWFPRFLNIKTAFRNRDILEAVIVYFPT